MIFLWLLSCFALIGAPFGGGAPTSEPELSIIPRIINGNDAFPGSWPWHVALQSESGMIFCGGTLLNWFWVMTAAHCNISTSVRVITGLYDRLSTLDNTQVLSIEKIFLHPKYNSSTFFGDIALLLLSSPVNEYAMISPAILPFFAEEITVGTWCLIVGWGSIHPKITLVPWKLQQAIVAVISYAECKKHWGRFLGPTMVCAWAQDVSNSRGDSGGPLVCPKDGLWKVVGIASHANASYPTSKPVVFTQVAPFIPWVQEIISHH